MSVLVAAIASIALQAHAVPIAVSVTSPGFTSGPGYGVDAAENGGTLLDVRFTGASNQNISWDPAIGPLQFNFGTIELDEPSANGGITGNETDGLGVTASVTLTGLYPGTIAIAGLGVALPGPDTFSIQWQPTVVNLFGIGPATIALDPVTLTTPGQPAMLTASVSPSSAVTAIAEPGTILLAGTALAFLGIARRRVQRSSRR